MATLNDTGEYNGGQHAVFLLDRVFTEQRGRWCFVAATSIRCGRIGDARFVLLGEASHGTSEFYTWRAELSKRLIEESGFSFIAVEGDWPDCYRVNRYVKGMADCGASAEEVLHAFERWPTWMWANREVVELVEWLRRHNERWPTARPRRLLWARRLLALGFDARGHRISARVDPELAPRRDAPTTASSRTPRTRKSTRGRRRWCRRRARTRRSRC